MDLFSELPNTRSGRLAGLGAALRSKRGGWGTSGRRTEGQPGRTPPTIDGRTGEVDAEAGPASRHAPPPATAPDWLKFVPAEVRGLVESHLPAGLPDYPGATALGFGLPEGMAAYRGPLPSKVE